MPRWLWNGLCVTVCFDIATSQLVGSGLGLGTNPRHQMPNMVKSFVGSIRIYVWIKILFVQFRKWPSSFDLVFVSSFQCKVQIAHAIRDACSSSPSSSVA